MKIGRQDQRSSAISTSNAETILVRGRDLVRELVGAIGFTEYFWLLVTGGVPSPAQRRVLDATLVAIAEHGLVPSVQASRMTLAAAPEALQGAVAAGILGCGSVVLGYSEAAGRFFATIEARAAAGADLEAAASVAQRAAFAVESARLHRELRRAVRARDDLIAMVWGGRAISESTLTSRINAPWAIAGSSRLSSDGSQKGVPHNLPGASSC